MNDTQGKQCTRRPDASRPWVSAMLCAAVVLACAHCTPRQRYQTLSFFFDGVPDPSVLAANNPNDQNGGPESKNGRSRPVKMIYSHKPHKEGKCKSCHGEIRLASSPAPDAKTLCSKCHTGFNEQSRFWHGPVAAWACGRCHAGHQSEHKYLLRKPVTELCATCHDLADTSFYKSNDAHAMIVDAIAKREAASTKNNATPTGGGTTLAQSDDTEEEQEDCTSCHDPHGSADRLLLKN